MTTWSGNIGDSSINIPLVGISPNVTNQVGSHWTPSLAAYETDVGIAGAQTKHTLAIPHKENGAGVIGYSFYDDWYNRIQLVPSIVSLGNLLSSLSKSVEIWNGFLTNEVLESITGDLQSGVSLGGPSLPYTLKPLESAIYTLSIMADGPPEINASYTFTFGDGDTRNLIVTGKRVVVFGLAPNWTSTVTKYLEWMTDIMTAYAGNEQRYQLRLQPRRGLTFSVLVQDSDMRLMRNLLAGWQSRVYGLPLWTAPQALTSTLNANSSELELDLSTGDIYPGALLIFYSSATVYETVAVDSIEGSNTVLLTSNTQNTWPKGTKVLPMVLARLQPKQTLDQMTGTISNGTFQFDFEDMPPLTAVDSTTMYRGIPVNTFVPETSTDIGPEFDRILEIVDYGFGLRVVDDYTGRTSMSRDHNYLLTEKVQFAALESWLQARAGRQNAFWAPTWNRDMVPTRQLLSTDTSLYIENDGYSQFINVDISQRDIMIMDWNNNMYFTRITAGVALNDQEEQLTIGAIGANLLLSDIKFICMLHYCRLDADRIEEAYISDSIANCSMRFRQLTTENV